MSSFDVRNKETEPTSSITWCDAGGYGLIQATSGHGGVTIQDEGLADMHTDKVALITDRQEGLHFIAAIQKAIDLGWLV